jgi:hypothetical protein
MPLSNKEIENRAIQAVLAFEQRKRRRAADVRSENLSYDVKSTGRIIEVKGIEKTLGVSGNWRFVQQKSVQLLLTQNNFYIYIVDNVSAGPENAGIYVLNRRDALPFLKIAPQISFTLQIPANQRERFRQR